MRIFSIVFWVDVSSKSTSKKSILTPIFFTNQPHAGGLWGGLALNCPAGLIVSASLCRSFVAIGKPLEGEGQGCVLDLGAARLFVCRVG